MQVKLHAEHQCQKIKAGGGMVPAHYAGHPSDPVLEGGEGVAGRGHYIGQCPGKTCLEGNDLT